MRLTLPGTLNQQRRERLTGVAHALDARFGDRLLGLVLAGSAGRGTDTPNSDLDLFIVLDPAALSQLDLSDLAAHDLDLIPVSLEQLERLATFGDDQWGYRWTLAWAPTLLDRTSGRIPAAVTRQQRLSEAETAELLMDKGVLDAWINLLYRVQKSNRDGRALAARLDAAESVASFLDIVFALENRVRPYSSYLLWSLDHHPLKTWAADDLVAAIETILAADTRALVTLFTEIRDRCARYPDRELSEQMVELIDSWTPEEYGALYG
jgi:predicted nucleotidyltransferase